MGAARDSILRSPRLAQARRGRRKRIIFRLVFFLIILVALPFAVGYSPWLRVGQVSVSSNQVVSADEIKYFAQNEISGQKFSVPKNSLIIFRRAALVRAILAKFSRLDGANIGIDWRGFKPADGFPSLALTITVKEREPFAVWCRGESDRFFLDRTGLVFDTAPQFSAPVYLIFVGGDLSTSSTTDPINKNIMNATDFSQTMELVRGIETMNLDPKLVSIISADSIEVGLGTGGVLRFSRDVGVAQALENLHSIISDPKLKLFNGTGGLSIEYIDLRFGNKVFYK